MRTPRKSRMVQGNGAVAGVFVLFSKEEGLLFEEAEGCVCVGGGGGGLYKSHPKISGSPSRTNYSESGW
jgi:hypothetical protein